MNLSGTKTINTPRLTLRRFTPEDAPAMFRNWASDPEVTKYLTWQTHRVIAETEGIIGDWCGSYSYGGFFQWAIELGNPGEIVGSIGVVNDIAEDIGLAHIGYCIGRKWWRQGITSEALAGVMRYLFEEVGVNCVQSRHDVNNPNSGAVMRKCGMKYEGTLRQSDRNNQGICDACYYSMTAAEWAERTRGSLVDSTWEELYRAAAAVQNDRKISGYVEAGGVAAAVLSSSGRIYTGVCIDTCSTLGICAERNAIFNMITCGEQTIKRVLAIMPDGKTGAPCGACRELMVQLMPDNYRDIEIMLDYSSGRVTTLGDITPEWWI